MNKARRIWWGTWPGAILLGVLAAALVLPGAAAGLITLLIPDTGGAGIDRASGSTPLWVRVFAVIGLASILVLPILTVRWARKTWLGYLILAFVLSAIIGAIGLGLFGIL